MQHFYPCIEQFIANRSHNNQIIKYVSFCNVWEIGS